MVKKKNILNTICLNLLVMLTEANLKGLQDFQHYSSTISSLKLRNDIAIPSVVINRFRATFVQGAKQHLRSEPPQKELFICDLKFLYQAKAQHRVDIFILRLDLNCQNLSTTYRRNGPKNWSIDSNETEKEDWSKSWDSEPQCIHTASAKNCANTQACSWNLMDARNVRFQTLEIQLRSNSPHLRTFGRYHHLINLT